MRNISINYILVLLLGISFILVANSSNANFDNISKLESNYSICKLSDIQDNYLNLNINADFYYENDKSVTEKIKLLTNYSLILNSYTEHDSSNIFILTRERSPPLHL
ncbi:MAG: hypothetical protein CMD88_05355 [Gammaproteobacteria bacterium]|nr:hypothetical protein [Gammaproteobacteria bacterium]